MTVRRVITGTDFTWDDAAARLDEGTFIQVEPASALETAIGAAQLQDLSDPVAAAAAAGHAGASN